MEIKARSAKCEMQNDAWGYDYFENGERSPFFFAVVDGIVIISWENDFFIVAKSA